MRLVGWLDPDHVSPEICSRFLATLGDSASKPADWKKRVNLASERVAEYEKRLERLETITGSEKAAREISRAKLELAVARAELELARVTRRCHRREHDRLQRTRKALDTSSAMMNWIDTARRRDAGTFIETDVKYITHRSSSALRAATLRVASAEAEKLGEHRSAEIALRRLNLRLNALEELRAEGFATRVEVEAAREDVRFAQSRLEQVDAQRSGLRASYDMLCRSADGKGSQRNRSRSMPSSSPKADGSGGSDFELATLPMSCLASASVVRHFIHLRQMRCAAEARRGAIIAELKMLENLATRLDEASKSWEDKQEQINRTQSSDQFRAVLAAGSRREQEYTGLDIELAKAQLLAAEEQLEVIRFETDRFAHQTRHQAKRANNKARSNAKSRYARKKREKRLAEPGRSHAVLMRASDRKASQAIASDTGLPRPRLVGYVESLGTIGSAAPCDPAPSSLDLAESTMARQPAVLRVLRPVRYSACPTIQYRFGVCRSYYGLCDPICLTTYGWGRPTLLSSSRDRWLDCRSDLVRHPAPLGFRWPSYSDYYAFGIRRTDFHIPPSRHGRATPYGGPWYYPGAPTNFR
jgi:hypothetical protein